MRCPGRRHGAFLHVPTGGEACSFSHTGQPCPSKGSNGRTGAHGAPLIEIQQRASELKKPMTQNQGFPFLHNFLKNDDGL